MPFASTELRFCEPSTETVAKMAFPSSMASVLSCSVRSSTWHNRGSPQPQPQHKSQQHLANLCRRVGGGNGENHTQQTVDTNGRDLRHVSLGTAEQNSISIRTKQRKNISFATAPAEGFCAPPAAQPPGQASLPAKSTELLLA